MKTKDEQNQPKVKRTYQDSLFRFLFSDKESAIELYNALEGTNYGMDTEVEFTTLENVLYVEGKNDLGFSIAGRFVVLTEHQSTINGNMPLRFLNYAAQTYNHEIENEELFKRKPIPVLTPEFFVIYTGNENWDKAELRLSDNYLGPAPENSLELVVKIIDVRYNRRKAEAILERSEKLRGYSLLLNYVDTYTKEDYTLEAAIDMAVKRCIDENVLRDFLMQYGKEVRGMLYDDITIEKFAEIRGDERWADGRQQGKAEMQERINQLFKLMCADSRLDEYAKATEDKELQKKLLKEYGLE